MKKAFFDALIPIMKKNKEIYFVSVGLGWPRTDELQRKFPNRFIQTEASEQTALDICVGLAYSNKIPFIYTITPFLYRGFETIRTYINYEKLHCVLIGAGVKEEYGEHDGFSHSASDVPQFFDLFKNFLQWYPEDKNQLNYCITEAIKNKKPNFINIHR